MPDLSKMMLTVALPADKPHLRPHFEAIQAENGFRVLYQARDSRTGETVLVEFIAHDEATS